MTIRDLGYRGYEGDRLSPSHNTLVLLRHGIRRAWASWLVKIAIFCFWIPMLCFGFRTLVDPAVLMTFSAVPTASSAYVLAARMGYNGAYVAGLVTLSTLLGVASLPFALSLMRQG